MAIKSKLRALLKDEEGAYEGRSIVWILIILLILWLLIGPVMHIGYALGGGIGALIAVIVLVLLLL